jgi:hypothetical protein
MLMDVGSKIFSSVMNERAFKLLDMSGTKFQFGGTSELGCRDGLFVLKTMLNLQKNQNLPSHVAFIDLVKAYDTANHNILLDIIERYVAPPRFVTAVARIYRDLILILKIEKDMPNSPKMLEYDKVTTWLLCFSYSSCLPLPRHLKLHGKKQALLSALYDQLLV